MLDWFAFQTGAVAFIIAFAAAIAFFSVFKFLYQLVTPYNERALIRQGNTAAAVPCIATGTTSIPTAMAAAICHATTGRAALSPTAMTSISRARPRSGPRAGPPWSRAAGSAAVDAVTAARPFRSLFRLEPGGPGWHGPADA